MNSDQVGGLLRLVLGVGAGFAAKRGVDGDTYNWIVAGLMALGTGGWSWYTNRPGKVIPKK